MGYIFDALNRGEPAGQTEQARPAAATASRAPDQAEAPADAPLAFPRAHGVEPADMAHLDDRLVGLTQPASSMAEEYRAIRTGILARWEQRRNLVHTLTSATPQEGKTLTCLNLGLSFGELHNRRTLVIEADLRLPQFAKLLDLPATPGLMGVVGDGVELSQAVVALGGHQVDVLPAGRRANDQSMQVLSSTAMAGLVKAARRLYDHVIIDTPPVLELADAGIVGALSDEVLLVARMNVTPLPLVLQAARTLANYNVPVAGLIATDTPRQRRRHYRYSYRYQARNQDRPLAVVQRAA